MAGLRSMRGLVAVLSIAGVAGVAVTAWVAGTSVSQPGAAASTKAIQRWAQDGATGNVKLTGQVPLAVAHGTAGYVRPHPPAAELKVNFGLPIRDRSSLDALIAQEARTHRYLTRGQLYARFSPPPAQVDALSQWLRTHGFRITHVGLDRLGDHRGGDDGGRPEDAPRPDQRLHQAGVDLPQPADRAVPVLREHDRADRPCPARRAERLGTERRRPLLQRGAARPRRAAGHEADERSRRRLLPGRPPLALRRRRPRLRRHRADARLHAVGRRRASARDDHLRDGDGRPADHRRPAVHRHRDADDAELLRHAVGRGRPPAQHPREREHEQPVRRRTWRPRSTSSRPTASRRTRR